MAAIDRFRRRRDADPPLPPRAAVPGSTEERTTVAVSGGGPAGVMLGLLLARAGVEVTVLERHPDFFNDFRGDTVHPSTLDVLDEIGLADRVARLPHRKVRRITVGRDGAGTIGVDLGALGLRHPYIAMIPQWDFLTMLAERAASYPTFRLVTGATTTDVLTDGGAVTGLRYRAVDGEHTLRSALTVSADGRHSALRGRAGLTPRSLAAPMDVLWMRVPRDDGDQVEGLNGHTADGCMAFAIDRGDFWQVALVIAKGGLDAMRSEPVESLHERLGRLLPFLGDRVRAIRDWDDVTLLDVRLERLDRWYRPGYLCIGDAAHAMTPVGGVGINLAVQDAVATANLLAEPLYRIQSAPGRSGRALDPALLAAVQRRRWFPDTGTQRVQSFIQRELFGSAATAATVAPGSRPPLSDVVTRAVLESPSGARAASRLYSALMSRVMMRGLRPEHVTSPERLPAATRSRPALEHRSRG